MVEPAYSAERDCPEIDVFAGSVHQYMTSQIAVADQKAVLVIALAFGALAYFENEGALNISAFVKSGFWTLATLAACTLAALIAALLLAWTAAVPRMRTVNKSGYLVFWDVVGQLTPDQYLERVVEQREDCSHALLRHSAELAAICRRKFRLVRIATFAAVVGGMIGFAMLILY